MPFSYGYASFEEQILENRRKHLEKENARKEKARTLVREIKQIYAGGICNEPGCHACQNHDDEALTLVLKFAEETRHEACN